MNEQPDLIPAETLRERLSRLHGHDVGEVHENLFLSPPAEGKEPRAVVVASEMMIQGKYRIYPALAVRFANWKGEFRPVGFFSLQ